LHRFNQQTAKEDLSSIAFINIAENHRRKGLSKTLLAQLKEEMKKHNRETATITTKSLVKDGEMWAEYIDCPLVHSKTMSKLVVDKVSKKKIEEFSTPIKNNNNLRVELWRHEYPEQYSDSYLRIIQDFWETMPWGDEPVRIPPNTREFYKQMLEIMKNKNFHKFSLTAIDKSSDEIISFTDLIQDSKNPQVILQHGTGTLSGYKKKGYAKALKAMMIDVIREEMPEAKYIITENANDNPPMLSINEQMGFEDWFTVKTWSLSLEKLTGYLDTTN